MNAVMRRVIAGGTAVVAVVVGLVLAEGSPAAAGTCQRTVGIDRQVSAGEGARGLTFSVFSRGCAAPGGVAFTVRAGTAQATVDFRLPSGSLYWAAGDLTVRLIAATIVADVEPETDIEDFTVSLTALSGDVRLANATGQGRILDDDGPDPLWAVNDDGCGGGLTPNLWCDCPDEQGMPDPIDCVVVELDLSTPSDGSSAGRWTTVDGTARAGVDFVGVDDQTQVVSAGATRAELRVLLLPQPAGTSTRWFSIRISGVSAGVVVDALATVTIEGR